MTTKLELVNRVLLSVGERQVPSTASTTTSRLAADILDETILTIQQEGYWRFTRTRAKGDTFTWVSDTVTIPDIFDLTRVFYKGRELYPIRDENLNYENVTYTAVSRRYIVNNDLTVRVLGAVTAEEQAELTFDYIRLITLPVLDTDVIDVPRDFETLVVKLARANMYLQHLDDVNSYQLALRDYEQHKVQVLTRNNKHPGRTQNLFRTKYNRGRYIYG